MDPVQEKRNREKAAAAQKAKVANERAWAEIDNRVAAGVAEGLAEWKQGEAVAGARDGRLNVNRPNLGGTEHPNGGALSTRIVNRQIASYSGAPGRKLDDHWKDKGFGNFMAAISPQALAVRNDYSSLEPSAGGFLVPEVFRSGLLMETLERSIVRPRATVYPMSSSRLLVPATDATSNASTVFGGVTAAWTEEGAELSESEAKFARIGLDAKKLTARSDVPNELLMDDAGALDVMLNRGFSQAISWFEDIAFLTGSGVGEPLGVLNADAMVAVTKEAGQTANTIVWENIVKMFARMLPNSLENAVWVANIDTFAELATMALSVGTGGGAIWLQTGAGSLPPTILGRPLLFTEKLPTVGDAGDIMFIDFSHYLIGDRMEMRAESSIHAKFVNDITVFRIIERVDGRPGILSAITPQTGSDTLSPFVRLAARD
ncbi:MAG: phage major capsid protein [Chloroflexi bacterium]|nr:phage major capsid protein [Chloroflexota bacterium]